MGQREFSPALPNQIFTPDISIPQKNKDSEELLKDRKYPWEIKAMPSVELCW